MNKKILTGSLILLVFDQISKIIVEYNIALDQSVKVIDNFFSVTHTNNYGAAWGIFANQQIFLILITIILLGIIFRYMNTFKYTKRNLLAFILLLGGTSGNLMDRLFLGYVRDFIDFKIFNYNFPIFNLSDISIFIGVVLLIISIYKGEDNGNNS